jgi:poly(3-hydroxyalkanoate) depolymerase
MLVERDYLAWRGHRICVSETGEGEPLFLVPGLGCNADMWAPFMEHFEHRRLISFDAPGTGRSSTPLFPVSIAALAALAAAVLENRGVACADTIGFSYGGAIAQQLAYDSPQRVGRLVLAATTCGVGSIFGSAEAMVALATPARFYSRSHFARIAPGVYGGNTGRDPSRRRSNAEARHRFPPSSYGYAMQLLGGMGWSSWHFLADIQHETLVISGDDDPLVPVENARMLASRIPRARLEIVERAGHLFVWDEAEQIGARIDRFLTSRGVNRAAKRGGKRSARVLRGADQVGVA